MLTIELVDGLNTVRCVGTNSVWLFDNDSQTLRFIRAFFCAKHKGGTMSIKPEHDYGRDKRCHFDFIQYCKAADYPPLAIKHGPRTADLVEARIAIACALRNDGHSLPRIGRVMNKHHTTVLHYLKSVGSQACG